MALLGLHVLVRPGNAHHGDTGSTDGAHPEIRAIAQRPARQPVDEVRTGRTKKHTAQSEPYVCQGVAPLAEDADAVGRERHVSSAGAVRSNALGDPSRLLAKVAGVGAEDF